MPKPTPPAAEPLIEAVDRADALHRLRDRLAIAIDDPLVPYRDLAALTRRYADTLAEIEELDKALAARRPATGEEASPIDQLASWRDRRRTTA